MELWIAECPLDVLGGRHCCQPLEAEEADLGREVVAQGHVPEPLPQKSPLRSSNALTPAYLLLPVACWGSGPGTEGLGHHQTRTLEP